MCFQFWNLVPLDPMSLLVLYNEHNAALSDLIATNMVHRLPAQSPQEGPAPAVSAPFVSNAKFWRIA